MGVVTFDPAAWAKVYPTFPAVTATQAQGYFDLATTLYLSNSEASVVRDVVKRAVLLNLLVAHLAKLLAGEGSDGPSPLVGRVTSAGEGSVSVSADMPTSPGSAWFNQTTYGAMFWQGTARYRLSRYRPGPRPRLNGLGLGYGSGAYWGLG